jgi:hypothetical protein
LTAPYIEFLPILLSSQENTATSTFTVPNDLSIFADAATATDRVNVIAFVVTGVRTAQTSNRRLNLPTAAASKCLIYPGNFYFHFYFPFLDLLIWIYFSPKFLSFLGLLLIALAIH